MSGLELGGLLGGAAEQSGAQAGAYEEDGDGGSEGTRAYDGGAVFAEAGWAHEMG